MKVVKLGERCWGVVEPGKGYPGHVFPTKWQAVAFSHGQGHCCPTCRQPVPKQKG